MKYHQLLGKAEGRMTADEIERTALDTGNLLALAALQVMYDTNADLHEAITDAHATLEELASNLRATRATIKTKE